MPGCKRSPETDSLGRVVIVGVVVVSLLAACGNEKEARVDSPLPRGDYALVFSGDGGREAHLFTSAGPGWNVRRLPRVFDHIRSPIWSPTFRHLADSGGYLVRADGTGGRELDRRGSGHAWSPDGTRLVYSLDSGEIVVVSTDGEDPYVGAQGDVPTWWNDGRLYFNALDPTGLTSGPTQALDPGSGRMETLPGDRNLFAFHYGEWSPDRTRVASTEGDPGAHSLVILRPDDPGEPERLDLETESPVDDVKSFAWSPDGKRLAVITGREDPSAEKALPRDEFDGQMTELYVVDVDDGSAEKIADVDASELAWSPNGGWIAMTRLWGRDANRNGAHDIWIVRPDGTGLRRVTDGRTAGKDYGHAAWVPLAVAETALAAH